MTMLREGDVIILNKNHNVYSKIPKHFAYSNCRGVFDETTRTEVSLSDDNFDYLRGTYIVTKTAMDGGGTGHGPHDIYPDGHHVFCVSKDGKHKVDFYQSGAFTAIITDIEPIGRAKLTWTV